MLISGKPRTKALRNILYVQQEQERKTSNIGMLPFLKSLLYRLSVKTREGTSDDVEIRRDEDRISEGMLRLVVKYCSDENNTNLKILWQELQT